MFIFDIDMTLIAPRYEDSPIVPGETRSVFGFDVFMAQHLIDFLRSRDDIHLLSTWGKESGSLAEAFGFKAKTLLIRDYSDEGGINGKFDAVISLKPELWADDEITSFMAHWCYRGGTHTIVPKGGYVSAEQLKPFM